MCISGPRALAETADTLVHQNLTNPPLISADFPVGHGIFNTESPTKSPPHTTGKTCQIAAHLRSNPSCTASRMSYLCSTNKKYCVSLWEFYVVGPQSGRDDVRPRGNEQPAYCVRRRPSMCFVGDTLFTAVLIPMLGGYLLVDDTLASWSDMLLLRRY